MPRPVSGGEDLHVASGPAFPRFPAARFALAHTPFPVRLLERLLAGELESPAVARGLARPPLTLLADLAQATGDPAP